MVVWVARAAAQARGVDEVLVATDHEAVARAAEAAGFQAVMTSPDIPSGTDRVAAVVRRHPADIAINVQGDEPMISAEAIETLAGLMRSDPEVPMATLARPSADPSLFSNPNAVKVVCDARSDALYFSRAPIPWPREGETPPFLVHLGIYAYRSETLFMVSALPPSSLEQTEKLEQLRALEAGIKIRVARTTCESIGVDTPEDLERVRGILLAERPRLGGAGVALPERSQG
jgi:3-deoxy-manno-octulosonate cytidylyltransferase (CMP-KDO synthetase)